MSFNSTRVAPAFLHDSTQDKATKRDGKDRAYPKHPQLKNPLVFCHAALSENKTLCIVTSLDRKIDFGERRYVYVVSCYILSFLRCYGHVSLVK